MLENRNFNLLWLFLKSPDVHFHYYSILGVSANKDFQLDCKIICNPEDVVRSVYCTHKDDGAICHKCHIPICNECWQFSMHDKDIPKALVNDNFIGYIRKYFLERSVTWLEATIACPLFSGLVTYYIEGERSDRHHLMQDD